MIPPKTINVIHDGGFSILTRTNGYDRVPEDMNAPFQCWKRSFRERGNTLWRPGAVLSGHKTNQGVLQEYNHNSFYQTNNNVCQAIYKVEGYGFRVVCWFDNATGRRIA